jgi:hypothetical protein
VLVVVLLVGVLVGLVRPRRGRFGAPRAVVLVFAALALQVLSTATSGTAHAVLLGGSIVLGALWIGVQRCHLASALLGVGVALNVLVIAANGGMPVDPAALVRVGRGRGDITSEFWYKHVPMTDDTKLSWFGDRIPLPVQRNVISIGDVLMAIAICLWVADSVGSWWTERRSARAVHGEHGRRSGREVVGDGE